MLCDPPGGDFATGGSPFTFCEPGSPWLIFAAAKATFKPKEGWSWDILIYKACRRVI